MYNRKIMEIFKSPKNAGGLKGANGVGKVTDYSCGDIMKVYLKVNENEIIEEARFKTYGCVASIVTSSVIADLVKGKSLAEALQVNAGNILEVIGEVPEEKSYSLTLAEDVLRAAIADYYETKEKEREKEEQLKKESKN